MTHKTCSFLFLATFLAHHSQSTSPHPTLPPATTNISFNPSNYRCVDKPEWTTQSFLAGDCYSALDKFHNRKVDRYSSMTVEFYAANVTPYYPSHFWQATPQKYKYKTCTLAIVMLRDMPPSEVPVTTTQSTDLSSYLYVEMAARTVLKECLSVVLPNGKGGGGALGFVNPTGYDVVGTCLRLLLLLCLAGRAWLIHIPLCLGNGASIGVFIWDTDSVINRGIQAADTGPDTPWALAVGQIVNGSSFRGSNQSDDQVVDVS